MTKKHAKLPSIQRDKHVKQYFAKVDVTDKCTCTSSHKYTFVDYSNPNPNTHQYPENACSTFANSKRLVSQSFFCFFLS